LQETGRHCRSLTVDGCTLATLAGGKHKLQQLNSSDNSCCLDNNGVQSVSQNEMGFSPCRAGLPPGIDRQTTSQQVWLQVDALVQGGKHGEAVGCADHQDRTLNSSAAASTTECSASAATHRA